MHFAYEFSGKNLIVGLFCPVNESIWEHLKLMFFPLLLWWAVVYKIKNKTYKATLNTWIVAATVSLVVAPISVVLLFYGYTGVFGIKSLIIDILLTFICYFIALCFAAHFMKYSKPNKWAAIISVIVIVAMIIKFVVFTTYPPEFPIFYR